MPKKAYLAEHLSSEELKDRYRSSQDSVETRRGSSVIVMQIINFK